MSTMGKLQEPGWEVTENRVARGVVAEVGDIAQRHEAVEGSGQQRSGEEHSR